MRTRLNNWQVRAVVETETPMKFVELKLETPAHVTNDTVTYILPFPEGVSGVQINTIRVVSEEENPFTVGLVDGDAPSESLYQSLEEMTFHYDQVIIPYRPSEPAAFVKIHNRGSRTTKFTITIRGVEVS